ncbi:MAG TPA: bacteriohopanetetrol glucosamine biosynthesis glycosyltransferase HpnI [Caulobacteraceae bacterium]|nr:bacteriohopanetetrol glucosamine biosynthesis glycosyltransferase HpnI [Caulobacteraceae bacterium]
MILAAVLLALGWALAGAALAGTLLAVISAALTERYLAGPVGLGPAFASTSPDVSLIKPLHGAPAGLARSLESFRDQDYPGEIEMLLGIQDGGDAAVAIAGAVAGGPGAKVVVVVDPTLHGANRKVSNLINIAAAASHGILILSDADIRVEPGYLRAVVAELGESGVGAVSCLYVGEGVVGPWSRMSAMGINYNFLPNAVLGKALGLAHPCFGSTIALRRETLSAIGGFEVFADSLADDYEIGRAVRALGLKVAIPPIVVTHVCDESSAWALLAHELRWTRTVWRIDAPGHVGSLVTHAFPLAVIAAALLGFQPAALGLIFTTLVARMFLKLRIDTVTGARAGPWWLLPLRDVLSFGVFLVSFLGPNVTWQGRRFRVDRDGVLNHR